MAGENDGEGRGENEGKGHGRFVGDAKGSGQLLSGESGRSRLVCGTAVLASRDVIVKNRRWAGEGLEHGLWVWSFFLVILEQCMASRFAVDLSLFLTLPCVGRVATPISGVYRRKYRHSTESRPLRGQAEASLMTVNRH